MTPIQEIWRRAVLPPEQKAAWKWAEDAIERIPYSPMGGGLDTNRHPAIRPVIDSMTDPAAPVVVLMIAVQAFKTVSLEVVAAWSIANNPLPIGFFLDQDANAKTEMKTRLMPLFENTKGVKELIPRGADRDKATTTTIQFRNGCTLHCLGAANKRNRQSKSLGVVLIDEAWLHPPDQRPIDELIKRTTAFPFPKVVVASQGGEEGSELDMLWQTTDKRAWLVPCLSCGEVGPLAWENVKFEVSKTADDAYDYPAIEQTAEYECPKCGHRHPDTPETRRDMNQGGYFEPTNPGAQKGRIGFQVNAISFLSWGQLVVEYLRAKELIWSSSDYGAMKLFHQQRLAQCFGDGGIGDDFEVAVEVGGFNIGDDWEEEAKWTAIKRKGKRTGKVYNKIHVLPGDDPRTDGPGWYRARALTVDIQRDCFFCTAFAYSAGGEMRLLHAARLVSWEEIGELATRLEIHPLFVYLDSGDSPFATNGVYSWAAEKGWRCLRGDKGYTYPHRDEETGAKIERYYSAPKSVNLGKGRRAINFNWSNLNVKDMLARLVQRPERFGIPDDIDDHCPDFRAQMNSERRVKTKTGTFRWQQVGKRDNHYWDCCCMALVNGLYLGVLGADIETESDVEAE